MSPVTQQTYVTGWNHPKTGEQNRDSQILDKYVCHDSMICYWMQAPLVIIIMQHPKENLTEIGSAVTPHHSFTSAPSFPPQWRVLISVENPLLQQPQLQKG